MSHPHATPDTTHPPLQVCHVLEHCLKEHQLYARGGQKWGHIGQGVIVYNTTEIESTLCGWTDSNSRGTHHHHHRPSLTASSLAVLRCSLADTIRVGDDFGKFALQYRMFEDPLIGMHGSFVVCQNAVEIDFGFDHGVEGSITEDTFFAMHIASHGVKVKWCEGHMFEQSPFNVEDFAKQRCRWCGTHLARPQPHSSPSAPPLYSGTLASGCASSRRTSRCGGASSSAPTSRAGRCARCSTSSTG